MAEAQAALELLRVSLFFSVTLADSFFSCPCQEGGVSFSPLVLGLNWIQLLAESLASGLGTSPGCKVPLSCPYAPPSVDIGDH